MTSPDDPSTGIVTQHFKDGVPATPLPFEGSNTAIPAVLAHSLDEQPFLAAAVNRAPDYRNFTAFEAPGFALDAFDEVESAENHQNPGFFFFS